MYVLLNLRPQVLVCFPDRFPTLTVGTWQDKKLGTLRSSHRNSAIDLPLKLAPKMYDEQMLDKESKGEIVCVMSNIWFDLYEPTDFGKMKARIPKVRGVCMCVFSAVGLSVCVFVRLSL